MLHEKLSKLSLSDIHALVHQEKTFSACAHRLVIGIPSFRKFLSRIIYRDKPLDFTIFKKISTRDAKEYWHADYDLPLRKTFSYISISALSKRKKTPQGAMPLPGSVQLMHPQTNSSVPAFLPSAPRMPSPPADSNSTQQATVNEDEEEPLTLESIDQVLFGDLPLNAPLHIHKATLFTHHPHAATEKKKTPEENKPEDDDILKYLDPKYR